MGQEGDTGEKGEIGLKGKEGPLGSPGLTGVRVSEWFHQQNGSNKHGLTQLDLDTSLSYFLFSGSRREAWQNWGKRQTWIKGIDIQLSVILVQLLSNHKD